MGSKYDPLRWFLQEREENKWHATFADVEQTLRPGEHLPASAYSDRTWWANSRNRRRVQAKAWLSAGWETQDVKMDRQCLVFVRTHGVKSDSPQP